MIIDWWFEIQSRASKCMHDATFSLSKSLSKIDLKMTDL